MFVFIDIVVVIVGPCACHSCSLLSSVVAASVVCRPWFLSILLFVAFHCCPYCCSSFLVVVIIVVYRLRLVMLLFFVVFCCCRCSCLSSSVVVVVVLISFGTCSRLVGSNSLVLATFLFPLQLSGFSSHALIVQSIINSTISTTRAFLFFPLALICIWYGFKNVSLS